VTALDLLFAVPREGGNDMTIFLVQMMLIFGIFYFLLLRPQAKERRRHDDMLKSLKKGDEIVTNGGIIGRVVHLEDDRLTLRTGDNTRITVDRGRIAQVLDARGDDAKGEAKGGDAKGQAKGGDAKGQAKARDEAKADAPAK